MAMKTELATVAARDLQIIEYRGQRVVTTEQLNNWQLVTVRHRSVSSKTTYEMNLVLLRVNTSSKSPVLN